MRTLIVYFSLEGNTAYIADELARRLEADTLRLVPREAYHTGGFKKYSMRAFDQLAELAGTPLVCTELFRDPTKGKDPAVEEKLDRFVLACVPGGA